MPNCDLHLFARTGHWAQYEQADPMWAARLGFSPADLTMSETVSPYVRDLSTALLVIDCSSLPDDEITTDDCAVSQALVRNPSVLTGTRYDDRRYPHDTAQ